ncbi:MAG: hypothetical protein AAB858_01550 [Patescibacteria group bacterium]
MEDQNNTANKRPQPRTSPIVDSFSGDVGFSIEGISDHHMPFKYDNFDCVIDLVRIEMVNFQILRVKLIFTINGDHDNLRKLYEEEGWKYRRTDSVLKKYPEFTGRWKYPAPVFGLMLNKYLQVVNATCKVKYQNPPVILDQSADLVTLPDSFPPLADMPEKESYHYYDKKTTLFYTDLYLGEKYEFDIELEANAATFEFAPLFPFKNVQIKKIETAHGEYSFEPLGNIVKPTRSRRYSDWYEYELQRHETIGMPGRGAPRFRAASTYRGEVPLFDITKEVLKGMPKSQTEIEAAVNAVFVDINNPITLKNYETVRFGFMVMIPADKDVEIIVRTIKRPVPIRIYEQMQKMQNYQDVLIKYDIFNFSHKKMRIRVETEILNFTEKAVKVIFLHGINNKQDQKARMMLTQCPRLKRGLLEQLTKPEKAMMHCKVTDEDTKKVLYEETVNIDLLPNDEITWELKDIRSNAKYGMHEFVCSWITPRDSEGLIEKVRTQAALKRSTRSFGGEDFNDLSVIESHVRAVYEYLSEYGLVYVSQPFSAMPSAQGQRIVLPEVVLKNKAGNCIDLTVLFASILEGAGLYSLIFLTEDHAFIGWGNKNRPQEIIFLETTVIGQLNFDEAKEAGKKVFQDKFTMIGAPNNWMPPLGLMGMIRGCHLIDTAEIRYSGKVSARI